MAPNRDEYQAAVKWLLTVVRLEKLKERETFKNSKMKDVVSENGVRVVEAQVQP